MFILLYVFIFRHSIIGAEDFSFLPWFFAGMTELAIIEIPLLYYIFIEKAGSAKSPRRSKLRQLEKMSANKSARKK